MPATEHTSGGEVEHEVSMAEGILLNVTELKLYYKSERDHLAQVLLQLDCKCFFYTSMDGYSQTTQPLSEGIAAEIWIHSHPFMPS